MKTKLLLILSTSILATFPMFSSYAQHKHDHKITQGTSMTSSSPSINRSTPLAVKRTPPPIGAMNTHSRMKTLPLPGQMNRTAPSMGTMSTHSHMQTMPPQIPMKATPPSKKTMGTQTNMQKTPQATPGKLKLPLATAPSKGKTVPQISKRTTSPTPLTKSKVSRSNKTAPTTMSSTTGKKITPKVNTTAVAPLPQVKPTGIVTDRPLNANKIRPLRPELQKPGRRGSLITGSSYDGRDYYRSRDRYYGRDYYGDWSYGRPWKNGFLGGALGATLMGSLLYHPQMYYPTYAPNPYYAEQQIYSEQPLIVQQTIYLEDPDYLQQLETSADYQAYAYSTFSGDNVYTPSSDVIVNKQDIEQLQREKLIQHLEQDLARLNAERFYATRPIINLTY